MSEDDVPRRANAADEPCIDGFSSYRHLGSGAHGIVYRASNDHIGGRLEAIKILLYDAPAGSPGDVRLGLEAGGQGQISHPNVVHIYHQGRDKRHRRFVCMEYLEGGTLAERLDRLGRLDPREAARLGADLARGLEAIHAALVVHRDLKPSNILFSLDDVPKIADFGVAKWRELKDGLTGTHEVIGTPNYMSPEQAQGHSRDVGPAADIYALGAVLYHAVTGQPPFGDGPPWAIIKKHIGDDEPIAPRRLNKAISADLDTILRKCLAKEPGRRYASAAELAADLERFLSGDEILARRPPLAERAWRWGRRRRWALLTVTLLCGVALAGAAAGWTSWKSSLEHEVRARLDHPPYAADDLDAIETLLGRLGSIDSAGRVDKLRREVAQKFHDSFTKLPVAMSDDLARMQDIVDVAGRYDHALRDELRDALAERVTRLDVIAELGDRPTADDLGRVFGGSARGITLDPEGYATRTRDDAPAGSIVMSSHTSPAVAQIEAVFDLGDAAPNAEAGLLLGAETPFDGRSLAFSTNNVLAIGLADGRIELRSALSREVRVVSAEDVTGQLAALAFAPDGKTLAAAYRDGTVVTWRTEGQLQAAHRSTVRLDRHPLNALAFGPGGDWLALGGGNEGEHGWLGRHDLRADRVRTTWSDHPDAVLAVAVVESGTRIATACRDGVVRLWESETLGHPSDWLRGPGPARALDAGSDGRRLAVGGTRPDGSGWVLAGSTSAPATRSPWTQPAAVTAVSLRRRPGPSLLATAGRDGVVRLWHGDSGLEAGRVSASGAAALGVAFAMPCDNAIDEGPDLACGGADGRVVLWDAANRVRKKTLGPRALGFRLVPAGPSDGPAPDADPLGPGVLAPAAPARRGAQLLIEQDGTILRAVDVPLSAGAFRLVARRQDGLFSFTVSQRDRLLREVTFRPIFPAPPSGEFGWIWPAGARLRECACRTGHQPMSPSPLEQGDALVSRREFRRAAEVYAQQGRSVDPSAAGRSTRLDALVKQAFCLVEMGERAEPMARLKAISQEFADAASSSIAAGSETLALASFLRWQLLVEPGEGQDFREAATILLSLSSRHRFGAPEASQGDDRVDVAGLVPEEMRRRIVAAYRNFNRFGDLVALRADLLDRRRDAVEVETFFDSPIPMRLGRMFDALEIEGFLGLADDSRNRATAILALVERGHALGAVGPDLVGLAMRRVCWMERAAGRGDAATRLLDRWSSKPEIAGSEWELVRLSWSLERARNLAAGGDAGAAVIELERFFSGFDRLPDKSKRYGLYAPACLLHGFLLEGRGDREGAHRAWGRGGLRGRAWIDRDLTAPLSIPRGYRAVLAVLTDDSDAARQVDALVSETRGALKARSMMLGSALNFVNTPARAFLEVARTKGSKDALRRLAIQDVDFRRSCLLLGRLAIVGLLYSEKCLPLQPSDEEIVLVETMIEDGIKMYAAGRIPLDRLLLLQCALAWQTGIDAPSWSKLLDKLDEPIRGPAAYLIGQRVASKSNPRAATALYERALRESRGRKPLAPLAETALRQLGAPPGP